MKTQHAQTIKEAAHRAGFLSCGISMAGFLEEDAPRLENFLRRNYQGQMSYLENHFDKRLDPTLLVPGAKSVISLLYNYFPQEQLPQEGNFHLAKYAYGKDYHIEIKKILEAMVTELQESLGHFDYRIFVDSAPVLEKAWAARSGLGWVGKNGNLLARGHGSFFFLAEIICDLDLETDLPTTDHCGTCRKCIDACPTGAIVSDKVVDGSRCISYATIELKDSLPQKFEGRMEDWIFGCDICQDVCPWNRFSKPSPAQWQKPHPRLLQMDRQDFLALSRETFNEIFKQSAVKRTKYSGLMRNIQFILDHEKK